MWLIRVIVHEERGAMGRAVARIARWLSLKKSATKKLDTISKAKRLKAKKLSRQRRRKESECVDAPVDIGSTDAGKPEVEEAPTSGEKEERAKSADLEASPKEGAVSTNIASDGDDWGSVGAHALIVKALKSLGFGSPTAIQKEVIPLAIQERCDIVGAAETGSGKTLAFAIPILHYILSHVSTTRAKPQRKKGREREGDMVDLNYVVHGKGRKKCSRARVKAKTGQCSSDVGEEGVEEEVVAGEGDDLDIDDNEDEDEGVLDEDEGDLDGSEGDLGESEDDIDAVDLDYEDGDYTSNEEDDANAGSGSDGEEEGTTKETGPSAQLVEVRDNIPDDEFEAMIRGESVPPQGEGHSMLEGGEVDTNLLVALILVPTRELALQVYAHIKDAAKFTDIRACVLVGGMAAEKQERLLSQRPPIVIATPGRLWKLMSEGHHHLTSLNGLRFLVLDEADRMIEYGHFRELALILDRVNGMERHSARQTLIFSATLTLPRKSLEKKSHKKPVSGEETLDQLMSRIGLRDDVKLVDLTKKKGTAEGLVETRIMCSDDEKDVYLYYFILTYPGRTLVFVNSIDSVHRLKGILELLRIRPLVLHAHLQQRQRLKNLESFVANREGVMIASDVAARGLDIPHVQHVIHYQVPRNSELYVHRSGRTARAKEEGISVVLVGPHDLASYKNICRTLNRDQDLPTFPLDTTYLGALRDRVRLARRIEREDHRTKRVHQGNKWFVQQAKAMDIVLDEDLLQDTVSSSRGSNIASMKAELEALLKTKVLPGSVSAAYPTQDRRLMEKAQAAVSKGGAPSRLLTAFDGADALTVAKQTCRKVSRT